MVERWKDDLTQNEEIRCNLEDLRFGCFFFGHLKHQINFVLSWTKLALRVRLGGEDEKLLLVMVALLLKLLPSTDATFCDRFS